jgi:hypothetical protein
MVICACALLQQRNTGVYECAGNPGNVKCDTGTGIPS